MTTVDWPPEGGSAYDPTGGPDEFVSSSAGAADSGKGVVLDGGGKLDSSFLPASVVGAMDYKGNWDASGGGTPASTDNGAYYRVSVAGTIDPGARAVQPGDFVVYNGTTAQYDIINAVQFASEVTNDSLFPGTYMDEALNYEAKNDLIRGWNVAGILVSKGVVVKIAGSSSQAAPEDTQPEIDAVSAVTDTPIGVTWESIADAAGGFVTRTGMITGIMDTSLGSVGDPVYFTSSGVLTLTATGSVQVGIVASVGNPGDVMIVVPSEDTDVIPNRSDVPGDYTTAALNELNRLTSRDDAHIYRTTVASEAQMTAAVAALEAGDYSLGVFEITADFILDNVSYSLTRDLIVHSDKAAGVRPVLKCENGVVFNVDNRCRVWWDGIEFLSEDGAGPTLLEMDASSGANVAYGRFTDCKFTFTDVKTTDFAVVSVEHDNTVYVDFEGCEYADANAAVKALLQTNRVTAGDQPTIIANFVSCDMAGKIAQLTEADEAITCTFTGCRIKDGADGVVGFTGPTLPAVADLSSLNVTFRFDASSVVDRTIDPRGAITGTLDIYDNATAVPVGPSTGDAYLVKGSTYQTGNQLDGKDVENNDVMYYDGAAWQVIKPFVHEGIDNPIHQYFAVVEDQQEFRDAIIEMQENDSYKNGLFLIDGSFTLNGAVSGSSNFRTVKTTKAMRWAGEVGNSATWPVLTFGNGTGIRWEDFADDDFSFEIENLNMVFEASDPHFRFDGDESGKYARRIRCENCDFDINSGDPVFYMYADVSALIEFVNCTGDSDTFAGFLVQAKQVNVADELTGVSVHFEGCDFTSRLVSLVDDDDVFARVSVSASRLLATSHSGNNGIWEYYDAGAPSFFEVLYGADSNVERGFIDSEPTFIFTSPEDAMGVYKVTVASDAELQNAIDELNDNPVWERGEIAIDGEITLTVDKSFAKSVRFVGTITGSGTSDAKLTIPSRVTLGVATGVAIMVEVYGVELVKATSGLFLLVAGDESLVFRVVNCKITRSGFLSDDAGFLGNGSANRGILSAEFVGCEITMSGANPGNDTGSFIRGDSENYTKAAFVGCKITSDGAFIASSRSTGDVEIGLFGTVGTWSNGDAWYDVNGDMTVRADFASQVPQDWYDDGGGSVSPTFEYQGPIKRQAVTAGFVVDHEGARTILLSAVADVTSDATTPIADGYYDGQRLMVLFVQADTSSVTIQSAGNCELYYDWGGEGHRFWLDVVWDATASKWYEIARSTMSADSELRSPNTFAVGNDVSVRAPNSMGIGNDIVLRSDNALAVGATIISETGADESLAVGKRVYPKLVGEIASASGSPQLGEPQQTRRLDAYVVTADATPTGLTINGGDFITVPANTAWAFHILVTASEAAAANAAGYEFKGVIKRDNAGNTSIVGSVSKTVLAEDDAAWDCAVSADDTNEALKIEATGAAATTIRWHASITVSEVTHS